MRARTVWKILAATVALSLAGPAAALPSEAAVTSLKASVIGADVVRLTWKKVSNAKSYQVQVSTKSSFSSSTTTTQKVTGYPAVSASTPFTSATKLKVNTKYYFRVRACTDAQGSCTSVAQGWSSAKSGKTKYTYSTKPSGLVANNIASTSVELSFTNVSGAPGYRIRYYSKTDGAKYVWSQVEEVTLTGLRKATKYWISASVQQPALGGSPTSTNPTGDYTPATVMGGRSKEITLTTSSYGIAAPTELRISEQTHKSVQVNWAEPSQLSGNRAPQSTNTVPESSPSASPEGTVTPTASASPATTPPASASPPADGTPATPDPSASGTPSASQLSVIRPSALPAGYRYRVQYALNKNMSGAKYKDSSTNEVVLTGLKSNTNYYVRVHVVSADAGATKVRSDKSAYQIAKTRVPTGTISGTVSGLSAEQIDKTVATIYGSGGELVKQVDLTSNGSYSAKVRSGSYKVKINYLGTEGFMSVWTTTGSTAGSPVKSGGSSLSVSTGSKANAAPVVLSKGASLSGFVKNASGSRLNGVDTAVLTGMTSAREIEYVIDTPTTSGSAGSYRLSGLAAGYHWVRFVKSGYKTTSVRIQVTGSTGNLKVTKAKLGDKVITIGGNQLEVTLGKA